MKQLVWLTVGVLLIGGGACKNRSINEGEAFRPKEIHENMDYHFDKITVDGVEYLILSRDNNNPHEGFGFMAFRANQLLQKQDSALAYLRMMAQLQKEMYANQFNVDMADVDKYSSAMINKFFNESRTLQSTMRESYSSDPRTPRLTD